MLINKMKRLIKTPCLLPFRLDEKRIITLSDEKYLKYRYKIQMKKELNLDNPKTFNEKIQWLKLNDRNPKYTNMVDKYEVKEYISKTIGSKYIIPTIGIYENFNEIDFESLPNKFVMKCTHDSGSVCICKDKTKINIEEYRKKIESSLKINYYYPGREWPYKNVKPRIIIEKYLDDLTDKQINDYKFMCFGGKVECSFVCTERDDKDKGLAVTFFDKNWNKLPFERHYRSSEKNLKKPKNYDKMIDLAEKLSYNIPFVRVDFYEVNDKIYFGELTFYPGSGFEEFKPDEWDYKLGNLIDLNLVYKNEK